MNVAVRVGLLRPEELELSSCGRPDYELADLKADAKYVNYSADSPIIQWFVSSRSDLL